MCEVCWAHVRRAPGIVVRGNGGDAIAWATAVDAYDGPMKDIIHALKYDRRRSISPRLGALMRERGAALLRDAGAVVPVPLHPRRAYSRGFNQAHDLARHLGLPVLSVLKRVIDTPSQIDLPREQRLLNVQEAFAIDNCRDGPLGPSIVVLIDDVATTGATLESCAEVLLRRGVREVRALTAARVVHAPR